MKPEKKQKKFHQVTILGSGTSTGVPMLGCTCSVCLSSFKKNKRLRTSVLIKTQGGKNILIDCTPDLRTQLLNNKISKVHGAIITHDHADHVHGIDDLRPFCFGSPPTALPICTSKICGENLKSRFPYIFERNSLYANKPILGGGIPLLDLNIIPKMDTKKNLMVTEVKFLNENFTFFYLPHGYTYTVGVVHDKMCFITDCSKISDEILEFLRGQKLEILILDCLRKAPHSTHLHLDLSLEYAQRINAKQTGLIHLSHDFDHQSLMTQLQQSDMTTKNFRIFPTFDGQKFNYASCSN